MNSNKLKGCFSTNSDDWSTPKDIYNHFINEIGCIDPCPLYSEKNNLNNDYYNSYLFINPPYSKLKDWVAFINRNLYHNCIIYLLIPCRTDTKYFFELMNLDNCLIKLFFIKGRLKFGNSKLSAPFPSVLIKLVRSCEIFNDNGNLFFEKSCYFITQEQILKIY